MLVLAPRYIALYSHHWGLLHEAATEHTHTIHTLDRFEVNHFSSEVGKHLRGGRPGPPCGRIQHANAGQRSTSLRQLLRKDPRLPYSNGVIMLTDGGRSQQGARRLPVDQIRWPWL